MEYLQSFTQENRGDTWDRSEETTESAEQRETTPVCLSACLAEILTSLFVFLLESTAEMAN